jgi:DNA-binding MarR family transcriptional regulator
MSTKSSGALALTIAGLSKREALIWDTLAEQGSMNISQIASATRLHRPAVYATLPMLEQKGLLKRVAGKKRVSYRTTGSAALESWRASQDSQFARQLQRLQKNEPQLVSSDDVQVYHGKDIRRVWEAVLAWGKRGKVFYRYDGYPSTMRVHTYMPAGYYEGIEQKGVDRFVITNKVLRASAYKKRLECASRVLPGSFDAFEQGVSQFIFGESMALIDLTTETAFVIKNAALASFHLRLFQYLYQILPE